MALRRERLTSFSDGTGADVGGGALESARSLSAAVIFLALGSACLAVIVTMKVITSRVGWDLLGAIDAASLTAFFATVGVAALDVECVVRGDSSVLKEAGFARGAAAGSRVLRTSISFFLGCCSDGEWLADRNRVLIFFDGSSAGFSSSPSSIRSSRFRFSATHFFGSVLVACCFGGCSAGLISFPV